MSHIIKRTWAEVDADCIEQNYRAIRSCMHEGCKFLAIVKADAYGHGAPFVANEFQKLGADYFGVSNIEEAIQLRANGITKPILILGYTSPNCADELIKNEITQTILSLDYAKELAEEAKKAGGKIKAHIKIDSGMSRIGFLYHSEKADSKSIDEIVEVSKMPCFDLEGIFTHFAVSDEPEKDFTKTQFKRFTGIIDKLAERGVSFKIRHCCNSAGLLLDPEMQLDMCRPGIILYGLTPAVGMPMPIKLHPAMSLKTVISQVKTLPSDTAISYGMKYTTTENTRVATLPVGYADGFPRSLSNKGDVLINGKRARILGRVCMDQCMVNVSGIENIDKNRDVTLIGKDGGDEITMEEFAEKTGTINYEAACLIGKRVPRIYLKGGRAVGTQDYLLP